jgi:prophage regulatory protein
MPSNALNQVDCRAIRLADVCVMTGLSPATVWRLAKGGDFPRPFHLTPGTTAWDHSEVRQWLESKKSARG